MLPAVTFARDTWHGAISAGIAGGVAGAIAGGAVSGAMPPAGYNSPYAPPPCHTELRQEHEGCPYRNGEEQVCE
jgi:hypothetical protein